MDVTDKGKVLLSGFNLDPSEMASVTSIINNYKAKIEHKLGFKELKFRLRKSMHGKAFLHEIQGTLIRDNQYTSKATGYNLYSTITEVLEKLIKEAEHKEKRKS